MTEPRMEVAGAIDAANQRDAQYARQASEECANLGIVIDPASWEVTTMKPCYSSDPFAKAWCSWPEMHGVQVTFNQYGASVWVGGWTPGHPKYVGTKIESKADLGVMLREKYPAMHELIAAAAAPQPRVPELEQLRLEARRELEQMDEAMGIVLPPPAKVGIGPRWLVPVVTLLMFALVVLAAVLA